MKSSTLRRISRLNLSQLLGCGKLYFHRSATRALVMQVYLLGLVRPSETL